MYVRHERLAEDVAPECGRLRDFSADCSSVPGWQPHWVSLACDPALVRTLSGHSLWVSSVTVEGDQVVSGSWDRWSGKLVRTLQEHSDKVSSGAIQGDQVVSGSWDGTVKMWDGRSGKLLRCPGATPRWGGSSVALGKARGIRFDGKDHPNMGHNKRAAISRPSS